MPTFQVTRPFGQRPRGQWVSLRQHSEETRHQAAALVAAILPGLGDAATRAVVSAAYLHDIGKSHKVWQDALCALACEDDRVEVDAGRPWAKSGQEGRLRFAGNVAFRHELGSWLLVGGPLRGLIDGAADVDLARYWATSTPGFPGLRGGCAARRRLSR